jgi:hypothetical protein
MDKLPRQGARKPWQVYQNYVRDIIALRLGPVDDGVLEFTGPPAHPERAAPTARLAQSAGAP